MRLFLRTRGFARPNDYRFLGPKPSNDWWQGLLQDFAPIESEPHFFVMGDGATWRVYLSGIPSARKDSTETPIRWTVVAEGSCGPDLSSVAPFLSRVAGALKAAALVASSAQPPTGTGADLDVVFKEAFIEKAFEQGDAVAHEWPERWKQWLIGGEDFSVAPPTLPGTWWASLHASANRAAWLGRVVEIVKGAQATAVCMAKPAEMRRERASREETEDEFNRHQTRYGDLALITVDGPAEPQSFAPTPPKKKQTGAKKKLTNRQLALGVLAVVGIIALAAYILRD